MTIIGDIFTMEERARIQGLFSSVWGFVSLLGPAIGGVIVDGASWRFAFLLNIPLGLASMLLISRTCRNARKSARAMSSTTGARCCYPAPSERCCSPCCNP